MFYLYDVTQSNFCIQWFESIQKRERHNFDKTKGENDPANVKKIPSVSKAKLIEAFTRTQHTHKHLNEATAENRSIWKGNMKWRNKNRNSVPHNHKLKPITMEEKENQSNEAWLTKEEKESRKSLIQFFSCLSLSLLTLVGLRKTENWIQRFVSGSHGNHFLVRVLPSTAKNGRVRVIQVPVIRLHCFYPFCYSDPAFLSHIYLIAKKGAIILGSIVTKEYCLK